ncbi:MAG: polysaccharide deacetylase family protein [Candidatus Dormiibacterota bacterium]
MSEARGRLVALTVDAEHPDGRRCAPGNCLRILGTLDQAGLRATFFLQGRWVSAYPDMAREVARRGHLIGNHSHYHARMPLLSQAGQSSDVRAAQEVITSVVGVDPRPWFRSPFGAGFEDPGLTQNLARLGYRNVPWDADGQDWESDRTTLEVEESLVGQALAGEGPRIALLHSWTDQAAEALPGILTRLEQAGTEFVTVDQVLDGI